MDESRLIWNDGEKRTVSLPMEFTDSITVSAWVDCQKNQIEKMQVLAAKWKLNDSCDSFDAYDASIIDGLDTSGFLGAIFDGRYMYFSPQHDQTGRHGKVLRYDTHGDFHNPQNWAAYDAGNTDGLSTKGFYGGTFDGKYIYFTPRRTNEEYHTRTLRYNTQKPFKDESSWEAYDAGLGISYQGSGYDGRHVYFAPGTSNKTGQSGMMLRYDTEKDFKDKAGWQTFDVEQLISGLKIKDFDGISFDGKYVYFVPLKYSVVVRYDIAKKFTDKSSWQAFDARPLGMKHCVGAVFDGKYLYFVPYDNNMIVRYDINKQFESKSSWQSYDIKKTSGSKSSGGYDGAFYDGRYAYFIPFFYTDKDKTMQFHGEVMRYDTTKNFEDPSNWKAVDISNTSGLKTVGYNAGMFDGRYFYFAPWQDGAAYHKEAKIIGHGRVARYDSVGENGTFILKYCGYGHNGGLSGAVPGPSFIVNTDKGPRSVTVHKVLKPGRHQFTGTYNSEKIQLYIDGKLAVERTASGKIINNNVDVTIGNLPAANASFGGTIEKVTISNKTKEQL